MRSSLPCKCVNSRLEQTKKNSARRVFSFLSSRICQVSFILEIKCARVEERCKKKEKVANHARQVTAFRQLSHSRPIGFARGLADA